MKKFTSIGLLILMGSLALSFNGCKKDDSDDPTPTPPAKVFNFKIDYNVDGAALLFDSMMYLNSAGNQYSINKIHYYLSGFKFTAANGASTSSDTVIYVEAQPGSPNTFQIKGLEFGSFTSVSFLIGLDSAQNITDALPNTVANLNMAWPEPMGGGYHFMKFEGNFMNQGASYGFAMHLGKNPHLVAINLQRPIYVQSPTDIISLNMNINEWFKNPSIYDLNTDGNYSMGNDAAMLKLSQNGFDVFN